jgi:hypothetical protein
MAKSKADEPSGAVVNAVLNFIGDIPSTSERKAKNPKERARSITLNAALKATALSGTLALPAGPAGVVTIVPDLIGVWRIQAQMVADLAGAHGKANFLTQEQMLYCLFRHAAAQAVRDLVVRVGERVLIRRVTLRAMQTIARKVGVKVTQRVIVKSVARWLPVLGALGVGAYAYYDTAQVAATALDLFEKELTIDGSADE